MKHHKDSHTNKYIYLHITLMALFRVYLGMPVDPGFPFPFIPRLVVTLGEGCHASH